MPKIKWDGAEDPKIYNFYKIDNIIVIPIPLSYYVEYFIAFVYPPTFRHMQTFGDV